MATKPYFINIKEVIIEELKAAQFTIDIAVPWFTDHELFKVLLSRIEDGVTVRLITLGDKINKDSGINFDNIYKKNSKCKVWLIDTGFSKNESIMHNKFCIIDKRTVIHGSFNWTAKASINQESITLHKDENNISQEFIEQFNRIISLYFGVSNLEYLEYKKLWLYTNNLKNSILASNNEEAEKYIECIKKLELFISPEARKLVIEMNDNYKNEDELRVLFSIDRINKLISFHAMTVFNSGLKEQESKHYTKAIELYDEAIEIKPDLDLAWYKTAEIYEIRKQEEALNYYGVTTALNPSNFEAFQHERGLLEVFAGEKLRDELKVLEDFIYLNPKNSNALIAYGRELIDHKQYNEAEKVIGKAMELDKYNIYTYRLLGELYSESKQFAKAVDCLTIYLSVITDDQRAYLYIGFSLNKIGKHNEAINHLKKAHSLKPKDLDTLYFLADSYYKIKNFSESLKFIQAVIAIDSKDEFANELLGKLQS